jgi:BTB/POZ domain-containing protein 9
LINGINQPTDGETRGYDWDSGYTCHQLGSGAIVVQLAQPYVISSMRLLLWDCDDRSYSYYIEVSTNQRNWEMVCNRSREKCKSWQTIRFPPVPVVYIRIVGTDNTANEVFHCVHFECPSQLEDDSAGEDVKAPSEGLTGDLPVAKRRTPSSASSLSRSTTPQRVQLPLLNPEDQNNEGDEEKVSVPDEPAVVEVGEVIPADQPNAENESPLVE